MTSAPAVSSPPCARRSAISASVIAWLPPTGIGQPTECASVASINPAPAAVNDGIREMIWAATPVNSARASSPASVPQAGVPWASIRSPSRNADVGEFGSERLSPSSRATTSSERATNGPSNRRKDAPCSSSAQVRSRSR
uniref:Nitric oxide resistance protein n=1 Tax=Mycobacterium avium TaxID=1764 RepID=A0A218MNJ0_MYCAV|nr:nitric oxide resistance protein [Mycobacterium avium]